MGLASSSCCMNNATRLIKKDTIKIDDDGFNSSSNHKNQKSTNSSTPKKKITSKTKESEKESNNLSNSENINYTNISPNSTTSPSKSQATNDFIMNKIKQKQENQNQRRKSFSISMNVENPSYVRHKSRSLSTFGVGLPSDALINFQNKKAYKNLPSNQQKKGEQKKNSIVALQKSLSIMSNDDANTANSLVSPEHKKRKPIEIIDEPFSEKQLNVLRNILTQEGLISEEMDDSTINMIINTISYIRVKQNVTIFTRDNTTDNIYYIIEKGKLEYQIDGEVYELSKYGGIGTRALIKYSKEKCVLKASERCYLFCLPIEKYKTIAQDFVDKQLEEKTEYLKRYFFFKGLDNKELLTNLAKASTKIKYKQRVVLFQEDKYTNCLYYIIEGEVKCTKGDMVVKKVSQGDMFGEIGLFNQIESVYAYTVEPESVLLMIKYESFISVFGDGAIRNIVYYIFSNAIAENDKLSKFFTKGEKLDKLFNVFQLKFYFNDTVQLSNEKKIIIPISGTVFKSKYQVKELRSIYQKINFANESVIPKGKAFMESVTSYNELPFNILGDECVVFEADWENVEKSMPKPPNSDLNLVSQIALIKNHPLFKYLSAFKIFQLANSIHIEKYKSGQIILKDGPNSEKFFIIKSGVVHITISKVIVKILDKNHTFGDISSQIGEYSRKADFVAFGRVECYIIDKEIYEEIVDNDNQVLKPLKQLLVMNDLTISLENLYFIREIGCGAYGKVYLVHDQKKFYAMKTAEIQVMSQKKEMAQLYINEKSIMSSIEYPFVVQLHNTFKTRDYIFFLMEYVDGESLRTFLDNKTKNDLRNLEEVRFFGAILFNVLNYLQKNRIIHRDLKPDNLLIESNGYLKVIDFGVATNLANKDYTSTFIGTAYYISPEVILGKNYNFSVDYWAVGVILYEIFYGRVPFGFGLKEPNQIYKEITEKKIVLPSDPKNTDFNALIKLILNKNPNKRITAYNKIKTLPFFEGFDFEALIKMKVEPPYKPEGKLKDKDLLNIDIPFTHFMRNNIYSSSNELDELLKRNADDFLSDF